VSGTTINPPHALVSARTLNCDEWIRHATLAQPDEFRLFCVEENETQADAARKVLANGALAPLVSLKVENIPPTPPPEDDKLTTGEIVGIVIGAVAAVGIVVGIVVVVRRKKKSSSSKSKGKKGKARGKEQSSSSGRDDAHAPDQH
jgi:hypothetical protein